VRGAAAAWARQTAMAAIQKVEKPPAHLHEQPRPVGRLKKEEARLREESRATSPKVHELQPLPGSPPHVVPVVDDVDARSEAAKEATPAVAAGPPAKPAAPPAQGEKDRRQKNHIPKAVRNIIARCAAYFFLFPTPPNLLLHDAVAVLPASGTMMVDMRAGKHDR
jgi:hypothetical protein